MVEHEYLHHLNHVFLLMVQWYLIYQTNRESNLYRNIQGGQTIQSVIVPIKRVAPITQGQTLYNVDLNGQITGPDPATGNPVTLNGNINALFLLNKGGLNVEFNGDNSVALNAVLKR